MTGLKARYDFKLEWMPEGPTPLEPGAGRAPSESRKTKENRSFSSFTVPNTKGKSAARKFQPYQWRSRRSVFGAPS
jgi:hypothetical protein